MTGLAAPLAVDTAREAIVDAVRPVDGCERVPVERGLGRILAETLYAAVDVPPEATSAMDGFAVRHDDLRAAVGPLPVVGRAAAGDPPGMLPEGTAVRILTGAFLPAGADTVVPQEACELEGNRLRVREAPPRLGAHVRRRGEDVARDAPALAAGTSLRPQELGQAASVGASELPVRRCVQVALLLTGDELTAPGAPLPPGRIYDGNGALLSGLLQAFGCECTLLYHVADTRDAVREALREAAAYADVVLSSGGVSVGDEDHLKGAIEALGTVHLWRVAVKPGKPLAFGTAAGVPVLALPGNPVALFVTFLLFGGPLIRRLQGRSRLWPVPIPVPAGFARPRAHPREAYLRVQVDEGRLQPYRDQGSAIVSSAVWASGLARVPADTPVHQGRMLSYLPFAELLA